jgi:hypothetical protein
MQLTACYYLLHKTLFSQIPEADIKMLISAMNDLAQIKMLISTMNDRAPGARKCKEGSVSFQPE